MPSSPFIGLPGVICGISNDANFKQLAFGMTDLGNGLGALAVNVSTTNDLPYGFTTDAQTATVSSALGLVGFNGTTADRLRTVPLNADAFVSPTVGSIQAGAFLMGYNGTTWDRLRSVNTGQLVVTIKDASGNTPGATGVTDNNSPGGAFFQVWAANMVYNGSAWDKMRKDTYAAGPTWSTSGGSLTAAVATGTGNTVIKGTPGRLCRVVITTAGTTGNATIYDNATTNSGTVLAVIPGTTGNSSAAVGDVFTLDMPAAAGITAANVTNGPAFTVSYW